MIRIDHEDDTDDGPENNQGIGPWNPPMVTVIRNDWSSDINDYDSEYWEAYYCSGGPTVREERMNSRETLGPTGRLEKSHEQKLETRPTAPVATARQVEIVNWLKSSPLSRSLSDNPGFRVFRGSRIALRDSTQWDVVDWLLKEKFIEDLEVAGFRVTLQTLETMIVAVTFQQGVVPAPFV